MACRGQTIGVSRVTTSDARLLPPGMPDARFQAAGSTSDVRPQTREDCFRATIDLIGGSIQRLLGIYERDLSRQDDLRQDILMGLWRSLATYRGEASLRTYGLRVTQNVALRYQRDRARRRRRDEVIDREFVASVAADVEHTADERRVLVEVQTWLAQLPIADRQLMFLYLEGVAGNEIAEITGLSRSNVTTKVSRLRRKLAAYVGDQSCSEETSRV